MRRHRSKEQEKELAERNHLLRAWKKFHREELDAALAGPHGPMLERLVFTLKSLTLQSAPLLLAYIRGIDWSTIDYAIRLIVLHEVNTAVTGLRLRANMAPIDDGAPGARDNVFRTIRHLITSSRPAEAAPEPMPVHEPINSKMKELSHVK
jgi:hypothetical protein